VALQKSSHMFYVLLSIAGLALASCSSEPRTSLKAEYEIVRILPHDASAFTQGLIYKNGKLYESTGLYGQSSLREVEIETGQILRRRSLPKDIFGEGLTAWSNRLFQLTWREGLVLIYDADTLETVGSYSWTGEGWGITVWSNRLVASDGSARLRFFDPATLEPLGEIMVHADGAPVEFLNELETVGDEIFANIWREDRVARIDPSTGEVRGWLDFSALVPPHLRRSQEAVLNGLAYDPDGARLFITGKNWPILYEIRLRDK
jgi:glutamine cyclotransferase